LSVAAGKVAAHDGGGGHCLEAGAVAVVINPVVAEEEECLLPELRNWNRPADGAAIVVIPKQRNCLLGSEAEWRRVQRVVVKVLVGSAVELVGAALGDLIDDHSAHAVLRGE
jgi:hypothetical protein